MKPQAHSDPCLPVRLHLLKVLTETFPTPPPARYQVLKHVSLSENILYPNHNNVGK